MSSALTKRKNLFKSLFTCYYYQMNPELMEMLNVYSLDEVAEVLGVLSVQYKPNEQVQLANRHSTHTL